MKKTKLIYFFILLLIIGSCQDVVDIDVPMGAPRLVVDASLEFTRLSDTTIEPNDHKIRLTTSGPFFDKDIPVVENATVTITNLTTNQTLNFSQSFELGIYLPDSQNFDWNFDSNYELSILYNNEVYKASTKVIPSTPITSIAQGDNTLFEGDETEIIVSFTDDGTTTNFYLFDFDFNLFFASDDRFYQGEEFSFSYFYEDAVPGNEIVIKILGIDKQYFNYTTLLIEQSEEQGANPFLTPPVPLRGNIINTSNKPNYSLGYFNLSETYSFPFTIKE